MARTIEQFSDKELSTFINSYDRAGKIAGGIFSLAELHLETLRRKPATKSPKEITEFVIKRANDSESGTTTYLEVWQFLCPDQPWKGNYSGKVVGSALGTAISYCIRNSLPLVSTLVVQAGTGRLSETAIVAIYNDAKKYGMSVCHDPTEFVLSQAVRARDSDLINLPPDVSTASRDLTASTSCKPPA